MSLKFNKPTLVTLTAPTCAGKNYLLEALIEELGFGRIVSTTDRAPRRGEIEGVHYNFIDTSQSKRLEIQGAFAELVTYNGIRYGVTHIEMNKKLAEGMPPPVVILEPSGIEIYKQYCTEHSWSMFNIFVSTTENIRINRLSERTTQDICDKIENVSGESITELSQQINKLIQVNNKRLVAVIEQERLWLTTNSWGAIVSGTDLESALQSVTMGVHSRNMRSNIFN
jgi:guanylate kinase